VEPLAILQPHDRATTHASRGCLCIALIHCTLLLRTASTQYAHWGHMQHMHACQGASTRGRIDAFTRLLECTCPTCLPELCCQLTTPSLPQITLVHLPWLSSASDQSCRIVYCTGDEHNVGQPGSVIKCHPVPRSDCWSAATECAGSACHHLEQHPASSKIDSDPRAAGACL
jgi:hypothetical protein